MHHLTQLWCVQAGACMGVCVGEFKREIEKSERVSVCWCKRERESVRKRESVCVCGFGAGVNFKLISFLLNQISSLNFFLFKSNVLKRKFLFELFHFLKCLLKRKKKENEC